MFGEASVGGPTNGKCGLGGVSQQCLELAFVCPPSPPSLRSSVRLPDIYRKNRITIARSRYSLSLGPLSPVIFSWRRYGTTHTCPVGENPARNPPALKAAMVSLRSTVALFSSIWRGFWFSTDNKHYIFTLDLPQIVAVGPI